MADSGHSGRILLVDDEAAILRTFRYCLEDEGYNTVAGHVPSFKRGKDDLLAFLETHDPAAVVFDIAPPYGENWTFLKLVRDTKAAQGRAFVVTSTNVAQLEKEVGDTGALEVVGKPFDLQEIVDAVKRALDKRG